MRATPDFLSVAVNVIALPEVIDVTGLPADVTARVVVVEEALDEALRAPPQNVNKTASKRQKRFKLLARDLPGIRFVIIAFLLLTCPFAGASRKTQGRLQ
jgi:hypothetical protein